MKETDEEKVRSTALYQALENDTFYHGIPAYMHGALVRYIVHGIKPGNFLEAIIDNDLREACGRADDHNTHALPYYVRFFYNEAPAGCWGYTGATAKWCEAIYENKNSREQTADSC